MAFTRIYLRNSDIRLLEGCGKTTAWSEMNILRDLYSKQKPEKITLHEYAKYRGVPLEMIIEKISAYETNTECYV